jgi:DNA-binding Lrp family transcriptional regulator
MNLPKEKGWKFSNQMAISQNTIDVLNAIIKYEPTYQREIAKKTKLSDTTVNYIFRHLHTSGVIKADADVDKETGHLIKKIRIAIDKEGLKKVMKHFKTAINEIKKGKTELIEEQRKVIEEKAKIKGFRLRQRKNL